MYEKGCTQKSIDACSALGMLHYAGRSGVPKDQDKAAAALWNVSIAPGKSAKVVMKKAGTYDYFCRYHPNMTGRVIVK